jgi:transcription termination factor Rho
MSVISRSALESSSLADLHEIASELGLDGYRRLRKADLVAAIIERQGGEAGDGDGDVTADVSADVAVEVDAEKHRGPGGRVVGGRGRGRPRR